MAVKPVDFRLYPEQEFVGFEAFTDRALEWMKLTIPVTFPDWRWVSENRVAVPWDMVDPILTTIRREGMTWVKDLFEAALRNARTFTLSEWQSVQEKHQRN